MLILKLSCRCWQLDHFHPKKIMSKMLAFDMRISEINKYLDKIRDGDIHVRYEWRSKLTNWLESEGVSRQVAYNFSSSIYLGSQSSDNYHEVILAMNHNEEIHQFFKPWLEKYPGRQTQH